MFSASALGCGVRQSEGWRVVFSLFFFLALFFPLSPAGCGAVSAGCKAAPLSGMGTWRAEGSEF